MPETDAARSADAPRPLVVPAGEGETLDFPWGTITWIASGRRGNAREMTFGRVVIGAGSAKPPHRHAASEEVLHLLSGRLEHDVDGGTAVLEPGDTIVIPRGAAHHARSVGSADAVMLVAYPTPEREIEHLGAET